MPASWVVPASAQGSTSVSSPKVDDSDELWAADLNPRPPLPAGVNPALGAAELPTPVVEDYVGAICSPWVDAADVRPIAPNNVSDETLHEAVVWASEMLYVLSGRHWPGLCDRTIRPCNQACGCGCLIGPTRPILDYLFMEAGSWSMFSGLAGIYLGNWGMGSTWWGSKRPACCNPFGACLTCRVDKLRLPGPVAAVRYVLVDGVQLDPSDYVLEGRNRLRRLNGGHWPCGQDFTRSPAQVRTPVQTTPPSVGQGSFGWAAEWEQRAGLPPGTISNRPVQSNLTVPPAVTVNHPQAPTDAYNNPIKAVPADAPPAWEIGYIWGRRPPRGGRYACRKLALEIALALIGDKNCQLKWNVNTVTRRGVTATYGDTRQLAQDGLTGLWEVDQWIVTARGGEYRPRRPSVYRADAYRKGSGSGRPWTPRGA